eukprot:11223225-Lingulodinium_polyedra.AAC.1
MPAARAGQARKQGPDKKQERVAEEGDFPDLIPYHAGPPSMFTIRLKEGEDWAYCAWCKKS